MLAGTTCVERMRSIEGGVIRARSQGVELECAAVLGHCTDDILGHACGNVRLDLQGDLDARSH